MWRASSTKRQHNTAASLTSCHACSQHSQVDKAADQAPFQVGPVAARGGGADDQILSATQVPKKHFEGS